MSRCLVGYWSLMLLMAATVGTAGCTVEVDNAAVYTATSPELSGASLSTEGVWESTPWSDPNQPWLRYPGRGTIQLEHGMGRVPRLVMVYLAFDSVGTEPGLASGDLARLVDADENTVTIRNDTSASFFVRVVLQ